MKKSYIVAWMAALALARTSFGAIVTTETFDADIGVTDRDGFMTVGYDGGNDWMTGTFAFQAFATPQVDAFVVTDGNFTGNYTGAGITQIRFQMYAVNVLPSDLFIRIVDGANVFSYQFNPITSMNMNWGTFTVDLAWSYGWSGPSEFDFNNALLSVDQIEIQVARNTGVAQEYRFDNLQTLDTEIGGGGGPSAVPEPNTITILTAFAVMGLVLRRQFITRRQERVVAH